MRLIDIHGIVLRAGDAVLFDSLDFFADEGECVGLFAPTGRGKTTLLNHLAAAYKEKYKISYAFQDNRLLPAVSALKNVMIPLENEYPPHDARKIAEDMLAEVDMAHKLRMSAQKLSGGEQQRVNVARALAYPGKILLLDEPFHSQDNEHSRLLRSIIGTVIARQRRTAVIVSHNRADLDALCGRIVELR